MTPPSLTPPLRLSPPTPSRSRDETPDGFIVLNRPYSAIVGAILIGIPGLAVWMGGCGSPVKPATARKPELRIIRDAPAILRPTIGSQASVRGLEPTLVSGYGLVVGLHGMGSGDVPGPVRAVMEREMSRLGVGKEVGPFRGMTPTELLNSRDTAVVIVSAVIPPGSPVGTLFDVQVETLPGSATTNLEGGRLYTADLYQGLVRPAAPATPAIAKASGEVFINPFSDPSRSGRDSVRRTVGRILNGGVVTQPRSITLVLDAASHSRSRAMTEAINSRFPRDRGEPPTAKGINEEIIEITIPAESREHPEEFIELLRFTRVDQTFPEQAASGFIRALKEQPELSEALSLCLEAVGPVAIPQLRTMYDYPEVRPRMASIFAGARLGDMMVLPALEDLALTGAPGLRPNAVRLMGRLGPNPRINLFARELLNDPGLDVRIAAYETLERRGDPWVERRRIGDKFVIDSVPSTEPMIYATLQKTPKIVVFGAGLEVRRPVFASAWDGRLMVSNESKKTNLRVFFKSPYGNHSVTGETPALVLDLVEFLAHKTTPEEPAPGLDFTYSEVVGAVDQLVKAGAVGAVFVPESDRLALELIRSRQMEIAEERPELAPPTTPTTSKTSSPSPSTSPAPSRAAALPEASPEPAPTQGTAGSAPSKDGEPAPTRKRSYVVPTGAPRETKPKP